MLGAITIEKQGNIGNTTKKKPIKQKPGSFPGPFPLLGGSEKALGTSLTKTIDQTVTTRLI